MKAFFRAVLLIKYTENIDKHDFNSLKNYLLENNMI